jgi:hypothetical protein
MSLPFTPEQFFAVFRSYNDAVWPLQPAFTLLGFITGALALHPIGNSHRVVAGFIAFLWGWVALVYQLAFFMPVNPAAALFAALFFCGAALFAWHGIVRGELRFRWRPDAQGLLAGALGAYSLVLYPLIAWSAGREVVSLGLPCPTTLFTIALLGLLERGAPKVIFLAPVLWAVIGIQGAWLFGVPEDAGLAIAAAAAIWFVLSDTPVRRTA